MRKICDKSVAKLVAAIVIINVAVPAATEIVKKVKSI